MEKLSNALREGRRPKKSKKGLRDPRCCPFTARALTVNKRFDPFFFFHRDSSPPRCHDSFPCDSYSAQCRTELTVPGKCRHHTDAPGRRDELNRAVGERGKGVKFAFGLLKFAGLPEMRLIDASMRSHTTLDSWRITI